jgi:hypothetical protein
MEHLEKHKADLATKIALDKLRSLYVKNTTSSLKSFYVKKNP